MASIPILSTTVTSTSAATANAIAQRDSNGDIRFGKVEAATGLVSEGYLTLNQVTKTADYTLAATETVCLASKTSAIDIDLPAGASYVDRVYFVANINTGILTVSCASGDIDGITGTTGITIPNQYTGLFFVSDGTNWYSIGRPTVPAPAVYTEASSPVTVVAADSGRTFYNTGATANVEFDLPAAKPGLNFRFQTLAAYIMTIDPDGTETIEGYVDGAQLGAGVARVLPDVVGACFEVYCVVAGTWNVRRLDRVNKVIVMGDAADTYDVEAYHSGVTFSNAGDGDVVTANLPPATVGLEYVFSVDAAFELRIDPDGSETIALPSSGAQGTAGKYITADAVGEWVHIKCTVAGDWNVMGYAGTWAAEAP